ncbi:hypothetical protein HanXRQr2_Chr15g0694191 [Helianthus annuus]|uniref:Uncharacterized protein n=1 Tax=Helianthus annuus TaxID=4232 RepID=A0A251VQ80_HELAN|nr:hypothetical protein HanXRQr2_Chr15g0694191 [Helianthus annuus]KAJ0831355.1 hypothetical protein HanPSC8_Chr15g0666121 [Helianthus annuus]
MISNVPSRIQHASRCFKLVVLVFFKPPSSKPFFCLFKARVGWFTQTRTMLFPICYLLVICCIWSLRLLTR